ncbi:hypothetical protein GOV14_05740 [Candidatus Pacearchaeota archaeon]|nr:hypothetical protein [Candidatus Pacearchaeota archaeon]
MNYRKKISRLTEKEKKTLRRRRLSTIILAILTSFVLFAIYRTPLIPIIGFFSAIVIIFLFFHFSDGFKKSGRINKMETVFPDFLQLVSSNLRAGMTVDKSIMLAARPEFAPLDEEIIQTGKDITTGKNIERALKDLSYRIGSDKIGKTILIIISGIRAGGDIAVLLDETAGNMRSREFVAKRAASQVLMYVIFVFFAVAVFAPGLFALSNVLVFTMDNLIGDIDTSAVQGSSYISFQKISVSLDFILYYSIIFIVCIDILASLVIGLVNKGEEREGLKLLPFMIGLSLGLFFLLKIVISNIMGKLI